MSAPAVDNPGSGSQPPAEAASAPAAAAAAANPLQAKPQTPWTSIVLGASGATGRVLVNKLANNPRVERINAIVRRELPNDTWGTLLPANLEKVHQTVVDFDNLDASADAFKGFTAAFCCLGSTRSKAGSKEEFYKQDFGNITKASDLCKAGGVKHFALVSSAGADHTSFFHYLRTKGEEEQYLINKVQFPSLAIFRPGLLLTERHEEKTRWFELISQKILPVLHPILPEKHCGVHTVTVAEAMILQTEFVLSSLEKAENKSSDAAPAAPAANKSLIFENDEIRALRVAKL